MITQTTEPASEPECAAAKRLGAEAASQRLNPPESTAPLRLDWRYVIGITAVHLLALLALLPWFFSWTGVAVAVLGHYFVGTLGIGVGYHRLLTHRSFKCPKWLEHVFATLGVLCLQDTPARWVAVHRMHHQHSEHEPDPHSPLVSFFWSHMGWLFYVNREHDSVYHYERYVHDLLKDRYYRRFERWYFWGITYVLSIVAYFSFGFALGWALSGEAIGALQMAASIVVWGVFVRTLSVWHATWSVNSIGHLFGYRNYETSDNSRNNLFVGLFATGEGWHNNHHADPNSAKHGHKWWELDVTWLTIWFLEKVGLARDVKRPRFKPAANS